MALNIYKGQTTGDEVTADNYIASPHDALNGSWYMQKLYLRNDDATKYYTGISIAIDFVTAEDTPNASPNDVVYQLFAGDIAPTSAELKNLPYHNSISFSDIGAPGSPDTSTYYPFFLRIYVPGNSPLGKLTETSLKIIALENIV